MNHFDHGSIKPYCILNFILNTTSVLYFADNSRSVNVTGFKRMNVYFTVFVNQFCTKRADFFGNQLAQNLCGVCCTGRVILKAVLIQKFCTGTVCQYQTVSGCSVVVRSGESLIVHASGTTGCNNNNLCLCNADFTGFHIHKDCTRSFALVIFNQFDCTGKINYGNAVCTVKGFVAQGTHDFCTGVVLACMHTFAACSATVSGNHSTVSFLVKFNAKVVQPFDNRGSFVYQCVYQFGFSVKVSAAKGIKVVLCG